MIRKNFDAADETRPVPRGKVEIVNVGDVRLMRTTFEPGWRWSESVKPIARTESCQVPHLMILISGRMGVRMDDGATLEFGPGDVGMVPPGHDAWVVGSEPVVLVDLHGGATYAKS